MAAWNFSEGTGTTAADSSGNGHDATITGGALWIMADLPLTPTPPFEGFTITIIGGLDLTVPDVPGGLELTGTASFRVNASAGSLQLNVSGMVNLAPLGNALDLEGVVHFDLGPEPYTDPTPEFYRIFVLQTGQLFNTLSSIGFNVNGLAVLRFDTTPQRPYRPADPQQRPDPAGDAPELRDRCDVRQPGDSRRHQLPAPRELSGSGSTAPLTRSSRTRTISPSWTSS